MRSRAWGNTVLMAVLGLLIAVFAVGCDDGSEDMYKQISGSGGGNARPAAQPQGGEANAAPAAPAGDPAAPAAADPNVDGTPTGEGDPAAEEYAGPKITVEVKEVKAPYPKFDGKGYYDVSITAQAAEHLDYAVWDILFLDKDGLEVARQIQAIKISYAEPMDLRFTDVYCTSKPASIEFRITDKQAKKADDEGAAKEGTGRSGGGGGGGSATPSGGTGTGAN